MFPAAGYTKAEVVGHYDAVADLMFPYIVGRPLTIQRFPKGLAGKGFMQKNAPRHYPPSIERYSVSRRDGEETVYPVITEPANIGYLANQGTITFHVGTSRLPDLDMPDRLLFDLDPPEGGDADAREAAQEVGRFLDALGLPSTPMTTGSKGYHVVVPIVPNLPMREVSDACQLAAALLAHDHPTLLTDSFRKDGRKGRVYVDWLRNSMLSTGVAPWSLRPRPHAPVAVPISWPELPTVDPQRWTLGTVGERLDHDPLMELMADPIDAGDAIAAIASTAGDRGIEPAAFDRFGRDLS